MVSDEEAIAAFDPSVDREAVYDEKVAPLMQQIAELCRANGIPFLATFNFSANAGKFASYMMVIPGAHPLLYALVQQLDPVPDEPSGAAN